MRWFFILITVLGCLMGIQSLRAEESPSSERIESRFLKANCLNAGGEAVAVVYLPRVQSWADARLKDPDHMDRVQAHCKKKGGSRWSFEPHVASPRAGELNEACADDEDCSPRLSCYFLTGQCQLSPWLTAVPLAP